MESVDKDEERRQAAEAMVRSLTMDAPANDPHPPPKPQDPSPPEDPKDKDPAFYQRREDVIDRILELQAQMPLPKGQTKKLTKTKLLAKKRDELNRMLAEHTERALSYRNAGAPPEESKPEEPQFEAVVNDQGEPVEVKQLPRAPVGDMGAKALFQFNFIACRVAELASVNLKMKDKFGTDLEGWSEDLIKDRKQLEEILAKIYQQHGPQIQKYLTPINEYALFMIGTASTRLMANKKNVDSQPSFPPARTASPPLRVNPPEDPPIY